MATAMAPPTTLSGGLNHENTRKNQDSPRKTFHRSSVKPTKASDATMIDASSADEEDDGNNDDDDGNSGDDESSEDEADAHALSGAKMARVNHKAHGLAGHAVLNDDSDADDDDDDDDMTYAAQAIAGGDHDDDYAGVDEVSDGNSSTVSDDDKPIRRLLKEQLIKEFEQREEEDREINKGDESDDCSVFDDLLEMGMVDNPVWSQILDNQRRGNLHGSGDFHVDLDEDPFAGLPSTEGVYSDMLADAELAMWRMPHMERVDGDGNAQKRVRFADTRSHASSDSESDGEPKEIPHITDLFAFEDDPQLKRLVSVPTQDVEISNNDFNDADSAYDFDGEDERLAFGLDEMSSSGQDDSSTDSEDYGDTTDDESAEDQVEKMMAMNIARGKTGSNPTTPAKPKKVVTKTTHTPGSIRSRIANSGKGPVAGTFRVDPTRATMKLNEDGTAVHVRPPIAPPEKEKEFWARAKSVSCGRRGSPQNGSYYTITSPGATNAVPAQPLTAQSTLGTLFDGKLASIRQAEVVDMSEEQYSPFPTFPANSLVSNIVTGGSEDEEPTDEDMADLLNLSDGDDENEGNDTSMAPVASQQNGIDVFGTASSSFDANGDPIPAKILETPRSNHEQIYQNRSIIGSFRQNQYRTRHVTSQALNPAQRASASEYNALQVGRRAAGNSPMTPARKSRASIDLGNANPIGIRKNFGSPLTATARRPRSRGNSLAFAGSVGGLAGLNELVGSSPSR